MDEFTYCTKCGISIPNDYYSVGLCRTCEEEEEIEAENDWMEV